MAHVDIGPISVPCFVPIIDFACLGARRERPATPRLVKSAALSFPIGLTVRTRTGPAVRTASLLERRGFELPVSFVASDAKTDHRIILRLLMSLGKPKTNRRFESPPLHQ